MLIIHAFSSIADRQFLAKLATGLAKPNGVKVLYRRDIPALLSSTPATKIPGCGVGSTPAEWFATWGASCVSDLIRVGLGTLKEKLGEQLGAKVWLIGNVSVTI